MFFGSGLIVGLHVLHAQETAIPIQAGAISTVDWNSASDLQVLLQAVEMMPTIPTNSLPHAGTFWSAQHAPGSSEPWPPLPSNFGLPAWDLGDGVWLLADQQVDYSMPLISSGMTGGRMMAADGMSPPGLSGGGGDTNEFYSDSFNFNPDYGTNLWLAITNWTPDTSFLFVSNTVADIQYEIQYKTDLAQSDWQSANWFLFGSELTNWTPTSVPSVSSSNLFLRVRSWQDDGSGLPLWWQLQYFRTNGVDPYGDPAGDGWNNLQKFQNGMNPNVFYTPPAPQGVTVLNNMAANPATIPATIQWAASPGSVTGYTVERDVSYFSGGNSITSNVSAATTSYSDSISGVTPDTWFGGYTYDVSYRVQAHYAGGDSAWSDSVPLQQATLSGAIVPGGEGATFLQVSGLPETATAVRLVYYDYMATENYDDFSFNTYRDIPVSAFTNGVTPLSADLESLGEDTYGDSIYPDMVQSVDTDGNVSTANWINFNEWNQPFYDGRVQLKQNLIFTLRAANQSSPFGFTEYNTNDFFGSDYIGGSYGYVYHFGNPADYAYASIYRALYDFSPYFGYYNLEPFDENYRYRNFVFNTANVNGSGDLTTGASLFPTESQLRNPPYQFDGSAYEMTNSVLATNQTRWLYSEDAYYFYWGYDTTITTSDGVHLSMAANARNLYGLPYLSAELAYSTGSGLGVTTLPAGGNVTLPSGTSYPPIYLETAQPQFQTVEYDFWNPAGDSDYVLPGTDSVPGMSGFSVTNTSRLMIAPVGSSLTIAGYAKMAVLNGYSGVYGYLEQYFDQAYQIDASGNMTTNTTGILSPYGQFFATEAGPAALVTMPDVDTGQRGTDTVYCVSINVDANHDGNMDLDFSGADVTSSANPATIWANNGYDRFVLDSDDQVFYDDSVSPNSAAACCPYTPNTPTPNCNYRDGAGNRVIPCERDLQNFFRLWVCGIDTNLIAKLPAGSTITLNWGDVGSPNTANPTIDIFTAADPDGGIGYLTNSSIANEQVDSSYCPYIGRLAPGGSIQLNASTFANNWAGNRFIMCGVTNGTGGLNLTIADGSGNVLAQTTAYLQVEDIKQMYERWTVGDQPSIVPMTNAVLASDNLPAFTIPFEYTQPQDTNTPYILLVHGWNDEMWEKDAFAESAFKRLYWQGYHGRFGSFRWPTTFGFTDNYWTALTDPRNYDNGEYQAWQSAQGLVNKLNDLSSQYPGHVYVLAHSMGNVVAGEALRIAAQNGDGQLINTYVGSQAAIPAHVYDATVTTPYLLSFTYTYPSGLLSFAGSQNYGPDTPNIYGNRLTNNIVAVGKRISYYNEDDFALAAPRWCFDQITKPDYIPPNNYYAYSGTSGDLAPWNHFVVSPIIGGTDVPVDIVTNLNNLYKVMAYAAESRSTALGATPITTFNESVDLTDPANHLWLTDPSGHSYADHFWHSAEFRGDCWQEWNYWNTLLRSSSDGFNINNP